MAVKSEKKTQKKPGASGTLRVKLVRSLIGSTERQRQAVRGLGLRRVHQTVVRQDTPEIRGMIGKVLHLVDVSEGSKS